MNFLPLFESDLQNSVGSWRLGIGWVLRGDSDCAAKLNNLHEFLWAEQRFLLKSYNVDVGLAVLPQFEFVTVFEQIE